VFSGLPEWAERHIRDEHDAPVSYSNRFAVVRDILRDASRRIAVSACTQVGKTQVFQTKMVKLGNDVGISGAYVMPTEGDRDDHFQARWKPMVEHSPWLSARIGNVNRVGLQILNGDAGRSLFYFLATYGKSSGFSRGLDVLAVDEPDLCDGQTLGNFEGRLGASPLDIRWYVGNPSLAGFGIGAYLKDSDWKRWFVPCRCGSWRDLLADWPDCVDGEPPWARYVCVECGAELSDEQRVAGEWRPTQDPGTYSGYQVSRVDSTLHSANRLMLDIAGIHANTWIVDPERYIETLLLGRPYASGSGTITKDMLKAAMARGPARMVSVMNAKAGAAVRVGVDVHPSWFWVVALDGSTVIHYGRLPRDETWSTLAGYLNDLNAGFCVVDPLPETAQSEAFCRRMKGRAARLWYLDSDGRAPAMVQQKDGDLAWELEVDRTAALDAASRLAASEEFALPADAPEVEALFAHLTESMQRVLCLDKPRQRGGILDASQLKARYRYVSEGRKPDHLWHALSYALMAQRIKPPLHGITGSPVALGRATRASAMRRGR
jgi:hypothetical protein